MKKVISLFVLLFCLCVPVLLADNQATSHKDEGREHHFPVIVAKRSFIGQVGPISPTTLFVPSKDGTFRVSCYIDTAINPPSGNDVIFLRWSDDFNTTAAGFQLNGAEGPTGETHSQGSFVIRDKAGVAITVDGTATTATNTYNVYLIVEQI